MVLGVAKMFGQTPEWALHQISFVNAMMYSKTMPTFSPSKDKEKANKPLYDDAMDANNPSIFNNESFDDELIVRQ